MPKIQRPPADPALSPPAEPATKRRPNKTAYSHDSDTLRHPADDYPTPPGFVLPLLRQLNPEHGARIWDPCAGAGHLVAALTRHDPSWRVTASDLTYTGEDFLDGQPKPSVDWIITNPPYRHTEQFIRVALLHADSVAMLTNTAFLEGVGRSTGLFQQHPPSSIWMCNRRMRLPTRVSSTFSHCWLVWRAGDQLNRSEFGWLLLNPEENLVMPTGPSNWQYKKGIKP